MDAAQKVLFGRFPRAVGTNQPNGQLRQWVVHSEGEFDVFLDTVNGVRNAYASISWRPVAGALKLDKVSIDLDTPQKDGDDGWPVFGGAKPPDDEVVERMRADEYLADEVLAPVVDDARDLIERAEADGVPSLAVFSGLGMHVHLFYRERENPDKQIDTTAKKYIRDLNLRTADMSPAGDVKRVLRVPNAHRVHLEMEDGRVVGSRPAGVFTIPLLPDEVRGLSPQELLEMAHDPRVPDDLSYLHPDNRPAMQTYENYIDSGAEEDIEQAEMRKVEAPVNEDDFLNWYFESVLKMPCMYERITQPEPDHTIRRNCAVLLLNSGLEPGEVVDLFSRIGWADWNRSITTEQVRNIYKNGYSDMSCYRLRKEGFCVRADDPRSCPEFGWSGGRAEWK